MVVLVLVTVVCVANINMNGGPSISHSIVCVDYINMNGGPSISHSSPCGLY